MRITCDFLVLGSGVAGLTFALEAAKHGEVVVVTKRGLSDSNTNWAQGGIADRLIMLSKIRRIGPRNRGGAEQVLEPVRLGPGHQN